VSVLVVLVFAGVFVCNVILLNVFVFRRGHYTLKGKALFHSINAMFCLFWLGTAAGQPALILVAAVFYVSLFVFKDRIFTNLKQ
jgi:hypothetical protein